MPNMYEKRAAYNNKVAQKVRHIATQQALADPSDPFSFNRHASHLFNGVTDIGDYNVDWKNEYRITPKGEKFSVQIPCNVKRP